MAKKTRLKPRPKLTKVRQEMNRLSTDLYVIIAAGEDKKGKLNAKQVAKAQKTKDALDAALRVATCGQVLSAY